MVLVLYTFTSNTTCRVAPSCTAAAVVGWLKGVKIFSNINSFFPVFCPLILAVLDNILEKRRVMSEVMAAADYAGPLQALPLHLVVRRGCLTDLPIRFHTVYPNPRAVSCLELWNNTLVRLFHQLLHCVCRHKCWRL